MRTRLQVYFYHTLHATHQEFTLRSYQATDTTTHIQAALERFDDLLALEVVEEKAVVGSQPHTIIHGIVNRDTSKQKQSLILAIHHKRNYLARLLQIHHRKTRTPGSYPQIATIIGRKRRNTIMRQTGIGGRIMRKGLGMRSQCIESSLHGTNP